MIRGDLNDVTIDRVVEFSGPIRTVAEVLPDVPAEFWRAHEESFVPDYWDPGTDAYLANVQTWVLRRGGLTIVVDTGIGNDRSRPQIPVFAHLQTDFLERLSAVVRPDDVDIVVNTHIHYDHVGWNTMLVDGEWRPTFPNARYIVPRADYDYFHPGNESRMRAPENADEKRRFDGIRLVFADSIAPIEASGQLELWTGEYAIDDAFSMAPAPGHTPGSSVLRLATRDTRALFVGDMLHSPAQIMRPEWRSSFDLDAATARESRQAWIAEAARTGAVVFPAHFPGPGAALVGPDGREGHYAVTRWVTVPPGSLEGSIT
ncbi:MAG: fold metallo-hydrolase [Actinomycetota bacterium]|nr:fold metallo-hydrolase [Actinomycetota bacterium]